MQSRWLVASSLAVAVLSIPLASSVRADPASAPAIVPGTRYIVIPAGAPAVVVIGAPAVVPTEVAADVPSAAPATTAPASVPAWTIAARFPWDVAHADSSTLIGLIGLGLDLDFRTSDHTTIGLTTEASLLLALEDTSEPGSASPIARLRAGIDARWIFHDGTSLVVPECGPAFEVASRAWLGARAGFETLDEGTTSGHFAEVSIGWERLAGHVGIGPYLAVGIEDEPAAAYPVPTNPFPDPSPFAAPTMTSLADPQQSEYITLGMRIGGA